MSSLPKGLACPDLLRRPLESKSATPSGCVIKPLRVHVSISIALFEAGVTAMRSFFDGNAANLWPRLIQGRRSLLRVAIGEERQIVRCSREASVSGSFAHEEGCKDANSRILGTRDFSSA